MLLEEALLGHLEQYGSSESEHKYLSIASCMCLVMEIYLLVAAIFLGE